MTEDCLQPAREAAKAWRWYDFALLVIVLAVALGLRAIEYDRPATFDELLDLRTSTGKPSAPPMYVSDHLYVDPPRPAALEDAPPVWHVWTNMTGVQFPPLYSVTLRFWRDCFGGSNRVARAYSVAWSLVTLAFLFAAARLAMNRWIASLTVLAIAFAPTEVYFAQLIRPYSMVAGVGSIAVWLMTRIEVCGATRRRAIALAMIALLLMLTHYFAAGIALAVAIFGATRLVGNRRPFFITLAAVGVLYIVAWGPFALQQRSDFAVSDQQWGMAHRNLLHTTLLLLNAPFRLIVDRPYDAERVSVAAGSLFVIPWLLARRLPSLRPWALAMSCGLLMLVVIDLARSTQTLMVTRYLSGLAAPTFLLFVGCGWAVRRNFGYTVAAAILMMSLIYWQAGARIAFDVPSFMPYGQQIARRGKPGEAIITYGGARTPRWGEFVLLACTRVPELGQRPFINLSAPVQPDARAQLGERVWLLTTSPEDVPEQVVPGSTIISRSMIDFDAYLYELSLDRQAGQ